MTSAASLAKIAKITEASFATASHFAAVCNEIAAEVAANLDAMTIRPAADSEVGVDAQVVFRTLVKHNRAEVALIKDAMVRLAARFA